MGLSRGLKDKRPAGCFAIQDGGGRAGGKPLRPDPLAETGGTVYHLREEAEMVRRFFANRAAATRDGAETPSEELKRKVGELTLSGKLKLEPSIHARR